MTRGTVLVTGGTGYIGSFTVLALLDAGYPVVIVDNLLNSSPEVLSRIELLTGHRPAFHNVDITDQSALDAVFVQHPAISSVIHFAALKAVGESGEIPLDYYHTNVYGSLCLLKSMLAHGVGNIVFSSSATVYGDATRFPNMIPIPESCPLGPTNTYGNTKVTVETMIRDLVSAQRTLAAKESATASAAAEQKWNAALLRYFNPAGAHPSGIMGEDPQGTPYNLLPLAAQVAVGKRAKLLVFGADYASRDGTAIRDYIHILDLARGHVLALDFLERRNPGVREWNLGTGTGSTVFEIVNAFGKAVGRPIPFEVVGRRNGDVLDLTADARRAEEELGWKPLRSIEEACADLWRWTEGNPQGYRQQPPESLMGPVREMAAQR